VDVNLKHILFGETVDACAVFRKSVWVALGGYDEKMPIMGLEDWDFWIRALEMNFKFYHINTPLFFYRDVPHSMIKVMKKNQEFLLQYIVKKHAHLYARYILEVGKEQSYERRKPVRNLFRRLTGLRLAN
jgi:predicted glycosyltransferase involved in capsule biosynthesis